jgi:hypothetical protein
MTGFSAGLKAIVGYPSGTMQKRSPSRSLVDAWSRLWRRCSKEVNDGTDLEQEAIGQPAGHQPAATRQEIAGMLLAQIVAKAGAVLNTRFFSTVSMRLHARHRGNTSSI